MSSVPVLFEEIPGKNGKLGLITLNRPQALNALTQEMIVLMHRELLAWENNNKIKAVVVCAAEGRAFCAGGDLRLAYDKHRDKDPSLPDFFYDEYRLNHYLFHYSKPYISFLDGITMGGGAGISLNGSHCIATERTLFAMPETGIGFFPDVGGTYFLSRLPSVLGIYLGLTGVRLSGEDCLQIQLLDFYLRSADLPLVLKALAETPFHSDAHQSVNEILQPFHQTLSPASLMARIPEIEQHFAKSSVEEILDSLDQHPGSWQQETAALLRKKSPMSLKVTLRQLQEGRQKEFDQCMQIEQALMGHFIQDHDFYEGIRALLIDKDQAPHWQPAELNEISHEDLEKYFIPLKGESSPQLFS